MTKSTNGPNARARAAAKRPPRARPHSKVPPPWRPDQVKLQRKLDRLARLNRAGLTLPADKAAQRALAATIKP